MRVYKRAVFNLAAYIDNNMYYLILTAFVFIALQTKCFLAFGKYSLLLYLDRVFCELWSSGGRAGGTSLRAVESL